MSWRSLLKPGERLPIFGPCTEGFTVSNYVLHTEREAWSSRVLALIFEGASELCQEDAVPTPYLDFPVQKSDRVVYACSSDGDAVGVICFRTNGPEAAVSLLYVEPSSRRLGLASLLWARMLEGAYKDGALTVRAQVDNSNEAGVGFVAHVGAEDVVSVFEQFVPKPKQ